MLVGLLNLSLPVRAILVALLGLVAARFANWAIYTWAWNRRKLGPWSSPVQSGDRSLLDHVPIVGWYRLQRESSEHGGGYWIRPLLIELVFPILLSWYYCYYVSGGALPARFAMRAALPGLDIQLHWQFLAHSILLVLMTIATFIDFDEQSIPDYVTLPGTMIGLLGAALAPAWLPFHSGAGGTVELHASIPLGWPLWLNGQYGLLLGLLIVLVWGFALLERVWIGRRGFRKGVQFFLAKMFRHKSIWVTVLVTTTVTLIGVWLGWVLLNPGRWTFLLSSLFGLAFAGGVTWAVRISASVGLGVEALGFGDVTLMAMIGSYIGWQSSLLVFFIAPVVALLFVLLRAIITGDTATPYGPYLCAAVALLLVFWDSLWNQWAAGVFALGNVIFGIVIACVALMGVMLWMWRLSKPIVLRLVGAAFPGTGR